ncbi:MAG TPA: hypothetical protein VF173_19495 [Thermoanaerobaculia bacterium]|nr:hypothetical protein [Thermoanaerobaculia bacterium]
MRHSEYVQRKRELDERLRAGVELLEAAHRTEAQALEALWAAQGEPEDSEATVASLPAGKQEPWSLYREVKAAMDQLPEEFTKNHVCRVLDREPGRSSLHRALRELIFDGVLGVAEEGSGKRLTVYRKLSASPEAKE